MIRYTVTCQDAAGNGITIEASATTDEQACATVLDELNSWKAIRALPVQPRQPRPRPVATTRVETRKGFRVVALTGPESWVKDALRAGGKPTAMSAAFAKAASQ